MTTALVTGCAGFIGSRLAAACLARGDRVIGVDAITDWYDPAIKHDNLCRLERSDRFEFHRWDLTAGCDEIVNGAEIVYHLAGQPGVRDSWHDRFDDYVRNNVIATQRLLEASVRGGLPRLVFASSSSVYGNVASGRVDETTVPQPFSPYGVTKLAAEHLCSLYAENYGLPTVSLRYFTVYGPGQRPDMAIARLIEAIRHGQPFPLFGSGEQRRQFTYVDDVVQATLLAGNADVKPGQIVNVSSGHDISMNELIGLVSAIADRSASVDRLPAEHGDVTNITNVSDLANQLLGWQPRVDLPSGLTQMTNGVGAVSSDGARWLGHPAVVPDDQAG